MLGPVEYAWGLFDHAYQIQVNLFKDLAESQRMYQLFVTITAALSLLGTIFLVLLYRWPLLNPEYWLFVPHRNFRQRTIAWIFYFGLQGIRFIGEFLVLISVIFGVMFVNFFGWRHGGLVLLLALIAAGFWTAGVIFLKRQAIRSQIVR